MQIKNAYDQQVKIQELGSFKLTNEQFKSFILQGSKADTFLKHNSLFQEAVFNCVQSAVWYFEQCLKNKNTLGILDVPGMGTVDIEIKFKGNGYEDV